MGSRLFVAALAPLPITVTSLSEAAHERWPDIKLYPGEQNGEPTLGFFAPVDNDKVDFTFFERQRFITVDLGVQGAEVAAWFLGLAPANVSWVVFTEQKTEAIPVSSRASARELLEAVGRRSA